MVVGLILCIIANYVCCFFAAKIGAEKKDLKKSKTVSNAFFVAGLACAVVAAILFVSLIGKGNRGVGVGRTVVYVNGVRTSSSTYAATQNFFIGFMFFVLLFGTGMAIPSAVFDKRKKAKTAGGTSAEKKQKKPNAVALTFSILALIIGLTYLITGVLALTGALKANSDVAPIVSIVVSVILIALGIWGITVFAKRKKLLKNNYNNYNSFVR